MHEESEAMPSYAFPEAITEDILYIKLLSRHP
jgi:hypothetical protein